jgi:hypothetical protein
MSPYQLSRTDQAWFRCPKCHRYYVYEGEKPSGRVVHSQKTNPFPARGVWEMEKYPADAFFKRVTYDECPSCKAITPEAEERYRASKAASAELRRKEIEDQDIIKDMEGLT